MRWFPLPGHLISRFPEVRFSHMGKTSLVIKPVKLITLYIGLFSRAIWHQFDGQWSCFVIALYIGLFSLYSLCPNITSWRIFCRSEQIIRDCPLYRAFLTGIMRENHPYAALLVKVIALYIGLFSLGGIISGIGLILLGIVCDCPLYRAFLTIEFSLFFI